MSDCRAFARPPMLAMLGGAILAASPLAVAQDGSRRFVTGDDFGDFSGRDLEGGGMATQMVREAYTAAGVDFEIDFDEWPAGYDSALAGEHDGAFPWYYLPERDADFVFTDSIYELVERIFHIDGDPDVPDIRGAADLAGLNLCYPVSWGAPASIQAMFDSGELERSEPGDMSRCFDLLANGQVDAVLSPQLQGYATVETHPELDAFDVATASWEVRISTLSILLPKANGRERACGDAVRFGAGLATVRANGLFDLLARRWFGPLAQLASPSERYALTRRTDAGFEDLDGTAIGISGGSFLLDTGEGGVERVPLDELAWIGREGFDERDASRAWCLGEGAQGREVPEVRADADGAADDGGGDAAIDAAGTDAATTDATTDAGSGARTLAVAGPPALADELVPALLSDWLDRELRAGDDGVLAVADPSNDPREPDALAVVADATDAAFDALADLRAELALVDRPPLPGERAALAPLDDFPSPATEHVFALEAIVPVVHRSRGAAPVALDALAGALRGAPVDADGPGAEPARVHLTEALAASLEAADAAGDGGAGLALPAPADAVVRHPDTDAVIAAVAADPDALGLVAHRDAGLGTEAVRAAPIADCGLVHAPTGFAARTEEHPLSRRLYMYYSPRRADGFAGAFVRHAQSEAGQRVVAAAGLTDLSIVPESAEDLAGALANRERVGAQDDSIVAGLDETVDGTRRLSTTFRFLTGSARLDARAVRDAERLAGWLRERDLDASDVRLVGYADARGGYRRNCQLSGLRAASVAQALAAEGVDGELSTFGACEEAPVACNATVRGQDLNRRVEVWLRDGAADVGG